MQSGYKTITPIQLANAVWALDQGRIDHHGVRVYLACFVLVAVREAARRSQRQRGERPKEFSRYRLNELERLTRLSPRQVRRALRQLKDAGLLVFSEGEIVIAKDPLPGSETFQEELACRRSPKRPIPVPRSMLRFLAQNRAEALTKVVIAYLVRGLSMARRTGEINAKGTVKASWIASTFGLSQRAVKYAQATLRSLGWISKDTQSRQRKLNRDGAYFAIKLNWTFTVEPANTALSPIRADQTEEGTTLVNPNKSASNFAPPPCETALDFAPLKEDKETSYESKNQETRTAEPFVDGVCKLGQEKIRLTTSAPLPPPTLHHIIPEDLWQFNRLEELYFKAVACGWIRDSESMALNFIAAAVRAREVGDAPAKLFVAIVRKGLWHHITQAQEDRARTALVRFRKDNPDRFRSRNDDTSGSHLARLHAFAA